MAAASKKTEREIRRYLAMPYARELIKNEDGTWFARVVELKGCMTEGDTPDEAITNLDDAMMGWLHVSLEDGLPIPEPYESQQFSGKFVVRIPRSLHRALVRRADSEGVSLNQFVVTALSRAVGL